MDFDSGILSKLANALVDYLNTFAKLPPKDQLAAVLPVVKWVAVGLGVVVSAMISVVFWLHRRSARHAIEFAKEKVGLDAKISILDKANKELSEEKARLLVRCPVKVSENLAKELRDGNFERASLQATDFLKIGAPGIATIHRHLAEEALGRIEDGEAGLEAARLHALGWLAADPQSSAARSMVDAITDRMNRAPPDEADEAQGDYAELIRALERKADDFAALWSLGRREFIAGDYRVARLVLERAVRVGIKSPGPATPEVIECRIDAGRAALWSGDSGGCETHLSVLARQLEGATRASPALRADFTIMQANFLQYKGLYAQAIRTVDKVLNQMSAEKPEHKLGLFFQRASALHRVGRYGEAEAALRDLLPLEEKIRGAEHPDTLTTRYTIAQCLLMQGRAAEAEVALRDLLPLQEKIRGAEHPDTLTTRYTIAQCLLEQGRAAEAEAELRDLLPLQEKIMGAEHPETLSVRYNIARSLLDQGRAAEAEAALRDLLPLEETVLGAEHPETLATRYNIARSLLDQGRAAEAEPLLTEALARAPATFGAEHEKTGRCHFLWVRCLDQLGRHGEAGPHLAEAERLFAPLTPEHSYRRDLTAYLAEREASAVPVGA